MTNSDEIELADGRASLVVRPREGAAILRYDALRPGRAPTPLLEPSRGLLKFGSQLLIPWSNRISGGGFEFDGRFHAIEPNVDGEPFPLHGDAFQRPWRLTKRTGTELELVLEDGAIGPYRYHASVRYALEEGALSVVLAVENRAAIRLPYGLGFHPWFPRRPRTLLQARRTVSGWRTNDTCRRGWCRWPPGRTGIFRKPRRFPTPGSTMPSKAGTGTPRSSSRMTLSSSRSRHRPR